RGEGGDTLIEVLFALVVLGLASLALIIGFSTSISASARHRKLATEDTVLATATQEVMSAIQNQSSLFTSACSTPITGYPDYSSSQGFQLPAPYNQTYDVQYLTTNPSLNQYPVLWWNGSTFTSTCYNDVPQLVTISIVGTAYTNSFVVDYPVGGTNDGGAGQVGTETLSFLNVPVGGYAGSPFTTQPIVEVEENGSPVTTDLSDVVLSISATSPSTGVLSGCQGNEVLGVVTFSGCTIGTGGTFILQASDGNLSSTVSATFSVTAASDYLTFYQQPVGGESGYGLNTDPEVVVCAVGVSPCTPSNANTAWSGSITMTSSGGLFAGCAQATTATTVTVTVVSGAATMPSSCTFSGGY
ncbi:MAG: type IV pilus modification PilV family protein, partial [Minisyncoccia bacterium]